MTPQRTAEISPAPAKKRKAGPRAQVSDLLERYGRTYSEELGIDLASNTPDALFQWLCATILFSIRISANLAIRGAKALFEHGWTSPSAMLAPTWEERVRVLNRSGYARYDESTSTKLADAAERVLAEYGGDLRNLRERAGRDPERVRELLDEFRGIGEVGTSIFCREAQVAWPELYPFADKKALDAAHRLGLGESAEEPARLAPKRDYARLVAALVRASLAGEV